MKRWGLPIVALLLLVAIVLVSRQLGYIGRAEGGPLGDPGGYSTRGNQGKANRRFVVSLPVFVDGDPVRVTRARPGFVSPGVVVSRPRINRYDNGASGSRRWPPVGDRGPLVGRRLPDGGAIVASFRARRPGVYVIDGYDIDYERGSRSFRRHVDERFCFTVRAGSTSRNAGKRC